MPPVEEMAKSHGAVSIHFKFHVKEMWKVPYCTGNMKKW